MVFCPIYKDDCPESEVHCALWMKKEYHSRCKEGGCEGQGIDCEVCGQFDVWFTGGCCSLKYFKK